MVKPAERFERRQRRTRYALRAHGKGRLRLSVYRSGRHIYGQVIDDAAGRTLAAASTLEKGLREELKSGADKEAAKRVRSEEHTPELQSRQYLVCRLLL